MSKQPLSHGERAPAPVRLPGKVALVTGAGTGIGRAAALAFARSGAQVVLAGRREAQLTAVSREISAAGGGALAVPTDVSHEDEVAALIETVVDRCGQFDLAFNNAGITVYKPIEQAISRSPQSFTTSC